MRSCIYSAVMFTTKREMYCRGETFVDPGRKKQVTDHVLVFDGANFPVGPFHVCGTM